MREKIEYKLTNYGIEHAIDHVKEVASAYENKRKDTLRITLALEEALLTYQQKFGEEASFTIELNAKRKDCNMIVSLPGYSCNPFDTGDENYSEILQNLSGGQGFTLKWEHRGGANVLTYTFKKQRKNNLLLQLLISVAAAFILSQLFRLLPTSFSSVLADDIIYPIYETLMGLIRFISLPLVLLSVMWGVFSIGDLSALSRVGKKMLLRFVIMLIVLGIVTLLITMPFYTITSSSAAAFNGNELYRMILDIIPDNLLAPFISGNTLQIIFIAVIFGIAMLILADKTTIAAKFVEQTNYIVQLIMSGISKLIPAFVFLCVFELLLSNDGALLVDSYKMMLTMLLCGLANVVIYLVIIHFKHKVPFKLLIKKISSTFAIAITTASSAAAFADNVETCEKKFGIDSRIVNIGVPIGQTIFMPGSASLFFTIAIYVAECYDTELSLSWLLLLMLISVLLAIAAPPVPGGGLSCFALIIAQMGLPAESLALFCTLNIIPDFICTASNLSCLQLELVDLADSLDMLDKDKLHAEI